MAYTCPKGHTEGIQASYRCWLWLPVDTQTGKDKVDCGNEEIEFDDESFDPVGRYWCPTCGDTFEELSEVG